MEQNNKGQRYSLWVICISVVLLVGAGCRSVSPLKVQSRDQQRLSDIRQLQVALEIFQMENGKFPIARTPLQLGTVQTSCLGTNGFAPAGCPNHYLAQIPSDPGQFSYQYQSTDGGTFTITYQLEAEQNGLKAGMHRASPTQLSSN